MGSSSRDRLPVSETVTPISRLWRVYIYAIHGYVTEIMFTAIWDFVVSFNWKLTGNTSIWILPIYGISGCVIEEMYARMNHKVPFLLRILTYTLWTYCWEFFTGFILKQFGACPWDYTPFHGDFMGLVTLEYAPFWFLGCILFEKIILPYCQKLHWGPSIEYFKQIDENGTGKKKEF